jgi:predicted metalloprotease
MLGTTEGAWSEIFMDELRQDYPEPTLTLFSGALQSACGFAQSAVGPSTRAEAMRCR